MEICFNVKEEAIRGLQMSWAKSFHPRLPAHGHGKFCQQPKCSQPWMAISWRCFRVSTPAIATVLRTTVIWRWLSPANMLNFLLQYCLVPCQYWIFLSLWPHYCHFKTRFIGIYSGYLVRKTHWHKTQSIFGSRTCHIFMEKLKKKEKKKPYKSNNITRSRGVVGLDYHYSLWSSALA